MRLGPVALAVAVAAAVGAASYELGARSTDGEHERPREQGRVLTAHPGDVIRVPRTQTRCEVTHEGGIPNLFCTRDGRTAYQVVFSTAGVDIYDLPRGTDAMVPTYSVPAVNCGTIRDRGRLIHVDLAEGDFRLSCANARAVMKRYLRRARGGPTTIRQGGVKFECRTSRPDGVGWDYHCSHYEDPGTPDRYIDVGASRRPVIIR